jgi:hypothetical protein
MSTLIKQAADQIEKLVQAGQAQEAKIAQLTAEIATLKAQPKLAHEDVIKAEVAPLAKQAAAKLREIGLVSSDEKRDLLATQMVENPKLAYELVIKSASYIRAPKLGSVVPTEQPDQSANASWDSRVARGMKSL